MHKEFLIAGLLLILGLGVALPVAAQSFVNPGFESGTTGWTCDMEVNSASVYGGTGSNKVAEVDGHTNPNSTADDRLLCQTLTGFIIGDSYTLEFDATRRAASSTPTTVSVNVHLGSTLDWIVTRTGGWNMVRERITFTATSTSHALRISPKFKTSFGMLFDNFSISRVSTLPVTLVRFDAWPAGDVVELEWATATEQNNAQFIVQRSADTEQWEAVAEVAGAGSSQSMLTYGAVDRNPVQGVSYYRLKQVDLDGTVDLSEARPVLFSQHTTALIAWPNPATDRVHVRLDAPDGEAEVHSIMGQAIHVRSVRNGNVMEFDIAALPKGAYFIRTLGPLVGVSHFIKQ